MRLLPESAMKTSPAASTATAAGNFKPVAGRLFWVPPAGISTTRLLPVSAMKRSPAASTATPWGDDRPLPRSVLAPPLAGTSTTSSPFSLAT